MAFSVGVYDGGLRRALYAYKYGGRRALAGTFARAVATFLRVHASWFEEFGVIAGVPSYTGPGARRDWDPVGEILAALKPAVGGEWMVEPQLVTKRAETPAMTGLGWTGRQEMAQGPFRSSLGFHGPDLAGAQVLVFDDVLTEGSTLREVARVLRLHGAADVAGLVLARPPWEALPPRRVQP